MLSHQNLTPVQRAGQRLMVGFDGTQLDDTLKFYIDRIKIGGIILFARNLGSPGEIHELCRQAQTYARTCGQPDLFVGIDQEGGAVARLKPPFTQFDGNPSIVTEQDAVHFALTTAGELKQIGVNMNMAPVLDVPPDKGESVMQSRAFGRDPAHVARMGAKVIEKFQQSRIMAVAKHFPGIGRTVLDSHMDLPELDTGIEELERRDMMPFQKAIDIGVAGIMLSHIRYRSIDSQWPASLSPLTAEDLLRRKMRFEGLVLTDDLDMGAIAKHFALQDIVRQCLDASVDVMLICHPGPKIEKAFDHILKLHNEDEALARKEALAVERILKFKKTYLG